MKDKAKAVAELAVRCLQEAERKLGDPETSLADLVTMYEKLVRVFLILHDQPVARKEIIVKLMDPQGEEVSQEYRLVVEEALAKLIGE